MLTLFRQMSVGLILGKKFTKALTELSKPHCEDSLWQNWGFCSLNTLFCGLNRATL